MSGFQASVFIELMKKRYELCQSLLDHSLAQEQYIETDNYTALVEVLGKKQQLLGQMDVINKKNPSLKQDWIDHRDSVSVLERKNCDKILAGIEGVLEELMQHESEATESLVQRRDDTQKKLNEISKGVKVNEIYRDDVSISTHRHLDVGL